MPPNPKNSPTSLPGVLYVAATPIGNMDDITLRALKIFKEVDMVAAEDTRLTGRLLDHHGIKKKLISFQEHNERRRIPVLMAALRDGSSVALVSDAGTPTVSDPGHRLVRAAIENGFTVTPIPGASALLAALCAAGLPTDTFIFVGFLPKKKGKRQAHLARLTREPRTLAFYESPRRVLALLDEGRAIMGNRQGARCREMTKFHEEFVRGPLSRIHEILSARPEIKGECTLLVQGAGPDEPASMAEVEDEIRKALDDPDAPGLSHLARRISKELNVPRKTVYNPALEIKKGEKGLELRIVD